MIANGNDALRHSFLRQIVNVSLIERGDNVFDGDNAEKFGAELNRDTGDFVSLHQLLNFAQ